MNARWTVGLALFASACLATDPPEGVFECNTAAQCPAEWVCRGDGRCWRTLTSDAGVDGGRDAGRDGGPRDAGAPIDTGPPDAGSPSVEIYAIDVVNKLFRFSAETPGTISAPLTISGLQASEMIVGMSVRTGTGVVYVIGNTSRLYTVDTSTAVATVVSGSPFSPVLSGTRFGMDFNVAVDRIRVVSDDEQNFRLNPVTVVPITDVALSPAGAVGSVAYTNAIAGATVTTLFGLDPVADTLVMIGGVDGVPAANAGGITTIGALGVNTTTDIGFDIDGRTNTAYAALTLGSTSSLYTINLATGAATLIGAIGSPTPVRAIQVVQ